MLSNSAISSAKQAYYHVRVARIIHPVLAPDNLVFEIYEARPGLSIPDGLDRPRFVLPQTLVTADIRPKVGCHGEFVGELVLYRPRDVHYVPSYVHVLGVF